MSSPFSPESEDSTSDSSRQECESLDNAKSTQNAEPSSSATGQESPATPMSPSSMPDGSQVMACNWQTEAVMAWDSLNHVATELVPTMGQNTGMASGRAGVIFQTVTAFTQNQRDEMREVEVPGALAAEPGMKQQTFLFISSAEDSPAKTSQSPENEPVSPEKEVDYSMTQHESQTLFSAMEDGSSLRMYPDYFPATKDATLPSYSRRWPTSGFTTSLGECWTADTSECPNGGDASSSLRDALEETVPARFFLSPRAGAGILRRAEKRGRLQGLPPALREALAELESQHQDDGKKTTKTS